ncbi:hypothetical protein F5X97DRAFT_342514 [Nemania serpens]|nr:hypothetical protein F5X97DRAFT_342514 [Nemania serpens]
MVPGSQNAACHSCQRNDRQMYSCIQCSNLSFCNDCWSKWVLHLPGAVGYDDRPHEKANAQVVQRLRQILDPKRNEQDHDKELQNDDDTTWFGVARDSSNQAIFQDHGRFTTLANPQAGSPDAPAVPVPSRSPSSSTATLAPPPRPDGPGQAPRTRPLTSIVGRGAGPCLKRSS